MDAGTGRAKADPSSLNKKLDTTKYRFVSEQHTHCMMRERERVREREREKESVCVCVSE